MGIHPREAEVLDAPALGVVRGITVQPDGKLLLAASDPDGSYVARLLADGAPDPTFGEVVRSASVSPPMKSFVS